MSTDTEIPAEAEVTTESPEMENPAKSTDIDPDIENTKDEDAEADIEPEWGGKERSIKALFVWLAILFISPIFICLFMATLLLIGLDIRLNFWIGYAVGLAISTGIVLYFDNKGRVLLYVESNRAVILTHDIPDSAKREEGESNETSITKSAAIKLREGTHIIFPTDQLFGEPIAVQADYQFVVKPFAVSLKGKRSNKGESDGDESDMMVSGIAVFEQDPNKLMRLMRISEKNEERKNLLEKDLQALMSRLIEEECRKARNQDELLDALRETSVRINKRIKISIRNRHYGLKLKKFTLGKIDHTEKTQTARDVAGAMKSLKKSAHALWKDLNEGLPPEKQMGIKDALDQAMIIAKFKEATRSEKSYSIDQATLASLAPLIEMFLESKKEKS